MTFILPKPPSWAPDATISSRGWMCPRRPREILSCRRFSDEEIEAYNASLPEVEDDLDFDLSDEAADLLAQHFAEFDQDDEANPDADDADEDEGESEPKDEESADEGESEPKDEESEPPVDYAALGKEELKALAIERELKFNTKTTKAAFVEMLSA